MQVFTKLLLTLHDLINCDKFLLLITKALFITCVGALLGAVMFLLHKGRIALSDSCSNSHTERGSLNKWPPELSGFCAASDGNPEQRRFAGVVPTTTQALLYEARPGIVS